MEMCYTKNINWLVGDYVLDSLKYDIWFTIIVDTIGITVVLILCLIGITRLLIKKQNIIPDDDTYITIFGKKTTFLNIVWFPICVCMSCFCIFTYDDMYEIYKSYKNNEYKEGYYILFSSSRNRGGGRHIQMENLFEDEIISFDVPDIDYTQKDNIGSCYYVQYFKESTSGVLISKVNCSTLETIESYCDLDSCK